MHRESEPERKPTWVDKALIIAVFTFILWAFFFLPSRADTFQGEILVVFCNTANQCVEHRWPQEQQVMPSMCGFAAQQLAIEWLEQHPHYHVAKMRCGKPSYSL